MYQSTNESYSHAFGSTTISWEDKERKRLEDVMSFDLASHDIEDPWLLSITRLAAFVCGTSMSFITLVGHNYVDVLSRVGSDLTGGVRQGSFCSYAIESEGFFELKDILLDERFNNNYFIKKATPFRYYGAWPIKSLEGNKIGALSVVDKGPKQLRPDQIEILRMLKEQVTIYFQQNRRNKEYLNATIKAEKLSKARDDFLSNVSHELRTPLNAINGYSDFLLKTNLNKEQNNAVKIVKNSSEILITLVNDILDLSKLTSDKLNLEKVPFCLEKTVYLVYDLLLINAEKRHLNFSLNYDEKIPEKLLGDSIRINQILMNLASNALKFTEKGFVKIQVTLKQETTKDVVIHFSIIDTGIGIQPDKLETIFERFRQGGSEISSKYGGTGLGLNITKNLVELHGGDLKVSSKYGQGTEFSFFIKFDKVLETEKKSVELKFEKLKLNDSYMPKKIKLLVCEDNVVNINLIEKMLQNKVKSLDIAKDGHEAIDLLKRKNFDVILMDIHMPYMGGIECTKHIRNSLKLNLPILGFTANNCPQEKELCLKVGMNDYITKSFVSDEIYQKLENIFYFSKDYREEKKKELSLNNRKIKSTNKLNKTKISRTSDHLCSSGLILDKFKENIKENRNLLNRKFFRKSKILNNKISSPLTCNLDFSFAKKHPISNCDININIKNFNYQRSLMLESKKKISNFKKVIFLDTKPKCKSLVNYKRNLIFLSDINKENINGNIQSINKTNFNNDDFKVKISLKENQINQSFETSPYMQNNELHESFDINYLKEISCGDCNFEKMFIEKFIKNVSLDFTNLEIFLKNKNYEKSKFFIHKLKTPLGLFGFKKIIESLLSLDKILGQDKEDKLCQELFSIIKKNIKIIYSDLDDLLKRYN
jgi:signal transduction histidine kinase/CheY-like chemotaxis protein